MADARDIHGTVFKNGSATLLARVVGADGSPITQAEIESAAYTVYIIDEAEPDADTAVTGHTAVDVDPEDLVFDELQTDDLWDVDATGYNFRHVVDVSSDPAFAAAGSVYRIVFTLQPIAGQAILVRFRVRAI
jgi:hypothetical protein